MLPPLHQLRRLAPLACVVLLGAPSLAQAQEATAEAADASTDVDDDATPTQPPPPPDKADEDWENAEAEYRDGFWLSVSVGGGIGAANGFPNDTQKIGRVEHYTETGIGLGTSGRIFLGGALTDWLNFGIGLDFANIRADGTISPATTIGFRTEAFPLYGYGAPWRDFGAFVDAGLGGATTSPEDDSDTKLIDGGAVSHLSGGIFWEGIRPWKLAMGPFAGFNYDWSQSIRRPMALIGWRTSLYSAP